MCNLLELSKQAPNIIISVPLSDLIEFHKTVVEDTRQQLEEEVRAKNAEVYLTIEEVAEELKVDKSTLWRWAKKNYLNPVEIGGKRRYLKSKIDQMMRGGMR